MLARRAAWCLKPGLFFDDLLDVTVKEDLIREALFRSSPADLDKILTAIEGYRTCAITAERLRRSPELEEQRIQALECAGYCESTLQEFVATGRLPKSESLHPEFVSSHLRLSLRW